MAEGEEPYRGAYVTLEPHRRGFRVTIQALTKLDVSRTFHSKDEAWAYARGLWTLLRLPLRDLTEANVARSNLGDRS
jgi:hypothetical protein